MSSTKQSLRRQALVDELHGAGLRATPARIMVLTAVRDATTPVTHADVLRALAGNVWNEATIYRNLVALAGAGLVLRTDHGDRRWRYEPMPNEDHTHPHFVCSDCGDVRCLPDAEIRIRGNLGLPRSAEGGRFDIHLRGVCDSCTGA